MTWIHTHVNIYKMYLIIRLLKKLVNKVIFIVYLFIYLHVEKAVSYVKALVVPL